MKALRFLLLGIAVHLGFTLSAQTNKGSFLIGGDASFTSSTTSSNGNETKLTQISINPTVGYFIIDNLVVGASLPMSYAKSKFSLTQFDSKTTSLTLGPLVRYYIPVGKVAFFAEGIYAFGIIDTEWPIFDPIMGSIVVMNNNGKDKKLSLGIGTTYFVNESVGIEVGLFYTHRKTEYENSEIIPDYDTEAFNIRVGLQFYLVR
jgi:long-subunit fatty acid transport protein